MKKVINGRITSGFGKRIHPVSKKESFHNGVDIAAPIGTQVLCPCEGRVASIYTHTTGGKTIILADDSRQMRFGFCHLSEYLCKVGDPLKPGQVFAKSGNTGLGTGAHLHFSAKKGGRWQGDTYTGGQFIDPTGYIDIKNS